jgi:putative membrane protein
MKVFTKNMLRAALLVLLLAVAVRADDRRPIVERRAPDSEPATEQQFIARAIDVNACEVKLAERALKETDNKDVRKFAQMMKDDHTKARTDFLQLAKSNKIAVVEGLGKDSRERIANLAKLRGADFDREFMSGQVEAHEKALKLFNTWAKKATNSQVRELASKSATATEEHLRKAKDILATLKRS